MSISKCLTTAITPNNSPDSTLKLNLAIESIAPKLSKIAHKNGTPKKIVFMAKNVAKTKKNMDRILKKQYMLSMT